MPMIVDKSPRHSVIPQSQTGRCTRSDTVLNLTNEDQLRREYKPSYPNTVANIDLMSSMLTLPRRSYL